MRTDFEKKTELLDDDSEEDRVSSQACVSMRQLERDDLKESFKLCWAQRQLLIDFAYEVISRECSLVDNSCLACEAANVLRKIGVYDYEQIQLRRKKNEC